MNMRTIGIAVIVVALVAAFTGIVSATPEGATMDVNVSATTKTPSTVDTDDAEGGYITGLNATVEQSTAKWQGYCGNVTGSITLQDSSSNAMFNWDWSAAKGGEVLATTGTPTWATVYNVTTTERDHASGGINYLWGWQTDQSDDADATFDDGTGSVTVASTDISNTVATTANKILPIDQGWQTLVIADDDSVEARDDYIFVGLICNDKDGVFGSTADYQMIVPVTDTPDTTVTYNFYVEMT